MRSWKFFFLPRLLHLYLLYLISSEKSDLLDDESDDDGSDYGSSGTYSFHAFSLYFENSIGRVSGLGSGSFVLTGVELKCDIFAFIVLVAIGVNSKGVRLIKTNLALKFLVLFTNFKISFIDIVVV